MKNLNRALLTLIVPMAIGFGIGFAGGNASIGNTPGAKDLNIGIVLEDNAMNEMNESDYIYESNYNVSSTKSARR